MINMSYLIPKGDTLVTYYLLPLVGLNKASFGREFKSSYISKDGSKVYVELHRRMIAPLYTKNPNYTTTFIEGEHIILLFVMPSIHLEDASYFVKGLYSKMSRKAKTTIYATSTLPYNKTKGDFKMSSPILQALDKTATLRNAMMTHLKIWNVAESGELIDLPAEEWFIDHRIKQIKQIK